MRIYLCECTNTAGPNTHSCAHTQVLVEDPWHVATLVNRGVLLHEALREPGAAEKCFRLALQRCAAVDDNCDGEGIWGGQGGCGNSRGNELNCSL